MCLRRDNAHKAFHALGHGFPADGRYSYPRRFVALCKRFPDAERAVLARRFRCWGRGRPCAPVGLPSMNCGPQVQATAPAGVAPEPAALPPLPISLSVVVDQQACGALSKGRRTSRRTDQDIRHRLRPDMATYCTTLIEMTSNSRE